MKSCLSTVFVLCFALLCAPLSNALRLDRSLKNGPVSVSASASCVAINGNCGAKAKVDTQANDDAKESIKVAVEEAVNSVYGVGDVKAKAHAVATAVVAAYAQIISRHELKVYASHGGHACAHTKSDAKVHAKAISTAVAGAFAKVSNDYIKAAEKCYSKAVSAAAVTAIQYVNFGLCTNHGYDYIYARIQTTAFVETVATAFAKVLVAVKHHDIIAAMNCGTHTSVKLGSETQAQIEASG
eukprot:g7714.t1